MVRLLKRVRQPATVLLCRYFRQQVMCIHEETNQADHAVSSYERGARRPLIRGATSKVILAHLPPRALADIWHDHRRDIATAGLGESFEQFKASMLALRKTGIRKPEFAQPLRGQNPAACPSRRGSDAAM